MKTAAVICELNPLHSGHARLFQRARDMGADRVLALMSGDFVQRGAPAVMDRRTRARMALLSGADMVLSYPVRYATGSAERFASYAVRIIDGLGCVDSLVFGSESGSLDDLEKCARFLADEPASYRERLREALRQGKSYPAARAEALPEFSDILKQPNNILGVEYLKELIRSGSPVKAFTVRREGSVHGDDDILGTEASSSAIRKALHEGAALSEMSPYIPEMALQAALDSGKLDGGLRVPEALSAIFLERIWTSDNASDLTPYLDVTEDLARTIIKKRPEFCSMEQFALSCASKSLTVSHAARAVLHIALNLRKTDPGEGALITQLLGAARQSRDLLPVLSRGRVPVIVRPSAPPAMGAGEEALLREEIRLSNLYEAVLCMRGYAGAVHEMSRGVVWV